VVAQPDERHANRTASVLEWYDRHRAECNILFKQRRRKKSNSQPFGLESFILSYR